MTDESEGRERAVVEEFQREARRLRGGVANATGTRPIDARGDGDDADEGVWSERQRVAGACER